MAIIDYGVVVGSAKTAREAAKELRQHVIVAIKQGWQPLGGVSIEAERDDDGNFEVVAVQAMVKAG
jgi:hypothetical protein